MEQLRREGIDKNKEFEDKLNQINQHFINVFKK